MRMTKARKQIIDEFYNIATPVSAFDLLKKIKVNKTTVYRELDFLLSKNLIQEVIFADRTKRYELKDTAHHHHLVCLKCNNVEDVILEEDLKKEESRILKLKDFSTLRHNLEFFGYCKNCK